LRAIDLIPLFGFLMLKGRCYFCKTKISWRYPAVELITVLISLFWVWSLGVTTPAFLSIVFSLLLLTLSLIDQDVGLLPDGLTYSGIWLGLMVSLSYFFIGPQQAILGAMFGYLFLWFIATVYRFLRGHDGMGYGDCKMLAMLGAWVGVQAVVYIVILASGLAIGVALVWMFRKRLDLQQRISFGPYLAAAGAAIFLYQSYARGFLH
jgi:leader peptidase (prepilin peptidase)/N-methyltransferase